MGYTVPSLTGVAIISIVVSAAAASNELPLYQPDEWCGAVASPRDQAGSDVVYRDCIASEQEAYDYLKPRWAKLPADAQVACDRAAHKTPQKLGTYLGLQNCAREHADTEYPPQTPAQFQR